MQPIADVPEMELTNIDGQITATINSLAGRYAGLDFAAIFVAKYMIFVLVLSVAASWYVRIDRATWRFRAISCGLAVAAGLLLNQVILLFVSRVRPYDLGLTHLIVEKSADPSFPSDHATVVFAVAFTLILLRDRFRHIYLILAVMVALARIFIGVHFFGDVVGAILTAAVAAVLVNVIYKSGSKLNRLLVRIF